MLNRYLMWVVCNTCFWIGNFIGYLMNKYILFDNCYPLYNKLMGWSCDIDDKYNFDMWQEYKEDANNAK